jgi:hypothetical protein
MASRTEHPGLHDSEDGESWRGSYAHGQEYGLEAGGQRRYRGDYGAQDREQWRDSDGSPYGELRSTGANAGVDLFGQPADYAYRPDDHDFGRAWPKS